MRCLCSFPWRYEHRQPWYYYEYVCPIRSFPWVAAEILQSIPRPAHICFILPTIMGSRYNRPSWDNECGSSGSARFFSWSQYMRWWIPCRQWSLTKVKTILLSFGSGALHACIPELRLRSVSYKTSTIYSELIFIISTVVIYRTTRKHTLHAPCLIVSLQCHSIQSIVDTNDCVRHRHIRLDDI